MGSWSCDILGSDDALDTLARLEKILNLDEPMSLYPLPQQEDIIKGIRSLLESNKDKILSYKWQLEEFAVLACVYLATGAKLPSVLRYNMVESCYAHLYNIEKEGWEEPFHRTKAIKNHMNSIINHKPDIITSVPHEGLFEKIKEQGT